MTAPSSVSTFESGAVVANPGAMYEMRVIAAGLARWGLLRAYIATFGAGNLGLPVALQRMLPYAIKRRIEQELRRRAVPWMTEPGTVHHAAVFLECLFALTYRFRGLRFAQHPLLMARNRQFDRAVARRLQDTDRALICSYGAALESLHRCRDLGIPSYLMYPIAHHRFAEQILAEEAVRVPDYAATLQFHWVPPSLRATFESEIEQAHRIFVLSTFQKRTFVEAGVDESKLLVTPLGVDLELFQPGPTRRNDKTFRIVFAGQITQRKGISYLFDAFARASIPNSELLLVGRVCGTNRPWAHLRGIRHVMHVPRWKLPELYRQADVFVLPSLVEGFPLTAIEAMACGLPVILSENTFGSDVVKDAENGFLVPIRDPAAIADRLRHLHAYPEERLRIGLAARKRATAFSWDEYAGRVASIIAGASSKPTQSTKVGP